MVHYKYHHQVLYKLKQIKNIETTEPVGETWEVASLGEKSSRVGDILLSEICELNYLIKFINTQKNLSIQVHPDDEVAAESVITMFSRDETGGMKLSWPAGTVARNR